jgi:hypothetical protein
VFVRSACGTAPGSCSLRREEYPAPRRFTSQFFSSSRNPGAASGKLFEEEQVGWGGDLRRYLKNFELVRKKRPYLESFLSSDLREEAAPTKKEDSVDGKAIARAVESGLDAALRKYNVKINRFVYVGLWVLAGVYLVYNYGLYVLGFLIALVSMVGRAVGIW